jgi:hypothetical protein
VGAQRRRAEEEQEDCRDKDEGRQCLSKREEKKRRHVRAASTRGCEDDEDAARASAPAAGEKGKGTRLRLRRPRLQVQQTPTLSASLPVYPGFVQCGRAELGLRNSSVARPGFGWRRVFADFPPSSTARLTLTRPRRRASCLAMMLFLARARLM